MTRTLHHGPPWPGVQDVVSARRTHRSGASAHIACRVRINANKGESSKTQYFLLIADGFTDVLQGSGDKDNQIRTISDLHPPSAVARNCQFLFPVVFAQRQTYSPFATYRTLRTACSSCTPQAAVSPAFHATEDGSL